MVVSSSMYEMNVVNWNESYMQKLEVVQNKVCRVTLGANAYVAVEAIKVSPHDAIVHYETGDSVSICSVKVIA